MASFKSYKEIIESLKEIGKAIDSGNLSEEELSAFVSLSKKLYDRAVILNYKAMEEQVFEGKGKTSAKDQKEDPNTVKKEEEKTASEEFAFDFSGPIDEKQETETKQDESKEKETIEEEHALETIASDNVEVIEDESEKEVSITQTQSVEIKAGDEVYSFYERFTKVRNDSLMDKLSAQKVQTLKGAFGLNDKLQIINELFDGDSTKFEKAIETLDKQESDEKARLKLSEIAAQHQWEPDHLLVEDFAKMVERRYA